MKPRYWISIAAGTVAFISTGAGLWKYTMLPAEDVIFLALFGYIAGMGAAMLATEPRRSRRQHRARRLGANGKELWTLEKKEWGYGYYR